VAACFFGDGAIHQGSFHESLNMARIWNLPVIYLCENNQYGMGTDFRRVSSVTDFAALGPPTASGPSGERHGRARGAPGDVGCGARVRASSVPELLEVRTYRYAGTP